MRLIDADRIDYIKMEVHADLFENIPLTFDIVSRYEINTIPTVEAIPIEWIEQFGKENFYDWDTQYNAITVMLEAWKREKKNDETD